MSEENFDDEERFNLALHSEFDSALLDCLGEDDDLPNNGNGSNGNGTHDDLGEASDFSVSSTTRGNTSPLLTGAEGGGGRRSSRMPRLPSFVLEGGSSEVGDEDDPLSAQVAVLGETTRTTAPSHPTSETCPTSPFSSVGSTTGNTTATMLPNNNDNNKKTQMHPLAINSSASCPPTQHAGSSSNNNNSHLHPLVSGLMDPQMTTAALQAAFASSLMQFSSHTSFNPTTGFNPALPFGGGNNGNHHATAQAYNPALQFNNSNANNNAAFNPALVPLAYNALAAGVDLSNFLPQLAGATANATPAHNAKAPPVAGKPAAKSKANGKRRKGGNGKSSSHHKKLKTAQKQPPFLLFDAPCELRHNFIQSQRSHGIPDLDDTNCKFVCCCCCGMLPNDFLLCLLLLYS
jgi:hypothetical protein